MKKTLRTFVTAAMFAAANLSAMPVAAEDTAWEVPAETADESSAGNEGAEALNGNGWEGMNSIDWDNAEAFTGQFLYGAYGSFPTDTLNDMSNFWAKDFMPDGWEKDKDKSKPAVTTTAAVNDMIKKTTTVAQLVYGPRPTTAIIETSVKTTTVTPQTDYGIPYKSRYIGDINMDGSVDSFDMVALRRMLIKGMESEGEAKLFGDVNGDGKINVADMVKLQKYLLGKLEELSEKGKGLSYITDVEIEKITDPNDRDDEVDIELPTYDPIEDIVVCLYGIRPSKAIIDQAINDAEAVVEEQLASEDKE